MPNTRTALENMPPILLDWPMMAEIDGGMAVEVEPYLQYSVTFHCFLFHAYELHQLTLIDIC